jgi:hypothetical protein
VTPRQPVVASRPCTALAEPTKARFQAGVKQPYARHKQCSFACKERPGGPFPYPPCEDAAMGLLPFQTSPKAAALLASAGWAGFSCRASSGSGTIAHAQRKFTKQGCCGPPASTERPITSSHFSHFISHRAYITEDPAYASPPCAPPDEGSLSAADPRLLLLLIIAALLSSGVAGRRLSLNSSSCIMNPSLGRACLRAVWSKASASPTVITSPPSP